MAVGSWGLAAVLAKEVPGDVQVPGVANPLEQARTECVDRLGTVADGGIGGGDMAAEEAVAVPNVPIGGVGAFPAGCRVRIEFLSSECG